MTTISEFVGRRNRIRKTVVIRVYEDVGRMVEVIAFAERTTAAEITSPILEDAIKDRYLQALETLQREKETKKEKTAKK